MIKNSVYSLINFFILLKQAQAIPLDLKTRETMEILEKNWNSIIKRMDPYFFVKNAYSTLSELQDALPELQFDDNQIDLSNLCIENVPEELAEKMSNVEKLDLSNNLFLKFNKKWFQLFSKNLKELSLKKCSLNEENLKAIAGLESLEKLDISECRGFSISSEDFITILGKLKHLIISNCELDGKALEIIYSNAPNLEYLDFSKNDLTNFPFKYENAFPKFKKSLKVLKLIDCKLTTSDLEKFFIFNNLEEIDLSLNNFSKLDEKRIVEKLFGSTNKKILKNQITTGFYERTMQRSKFQGLSSYLLTNERIKSLYRAYTSQLKTVKLIKCEITSELFVTKLFDLENLESLKISGNKAPFNFEEIQKGKAYENLKVLEVESCEGLRSNDWKNLTNFPKLEMLNASRNDFKEINSNFELGCSKDTLKELKMELCGLNLDSLRAITDCPNLEKLNISHNHFENNSIDFGGLKDTLRVLEVMDCNLDVKGLLVITNFPNLEILNASWNDFKEIDSNFELGCSKDTLKELKMELCGLNLDSLRAITDCPNLEKLAINYRIQPGIDFNFEFGRSKGSLKVLRMRLDSLNSAALQKIAELTQLQTLTLFSYSKVYENESEAKGIIGQLSWRIREFMI